MRRFVIVVTALTLLAPALEQVELPWEIACPEGVSSVRLGDNPGVICDVNWTSHFGVTMTLTPEQAEAKAAALWTAANLARELSMADGGNEEPQK